MKLYISKDVKDKRCPRFATNYTSKYSFNSSYHREKMKGAIYFFKLTRKL